MVFGEEERYTHPSPSERSSPASCRTSVISFDSRDEAPSTKDIAEQIIGFLRLLAAHRHLLVKAFDPPYMPAKVVLYSLRSLIDY